MADEQARLKTTDMVKIIEDLQKIVNGIPAVVTAAVNEAVNEAVGLAVTAAFRQEMELFRQEVKKEAVSLAKKTAEEEVDKFQSTLCAAFDTLTNSLRPTGP